jgi:hypothetical protein
MYKSTEENFKEALQEARQMTTRNIKIALKQRGALHKWAVRAYETALAERAPKS